MTHGGQHLRRYPLLCPRQPLSTEGNPLGAVLSGSSTQLPHRSERPGAWVPSPSTAALRSPCAALLSLKQKSARRHKEVLANRRGG